MLIKFKNEKNIISNICRNLGPAVTQNEGNLNSLVSRISQICTEHSRAYFVPSQYRLQALKGIWQAQSQLQQKIREKTRKQVKSDQAEKSKHEYESSDESELSLRLIVCLLESQSRVDPSLTEVTTRLLSNHFRSRPPLHLKEQPQHLKSLENLLHSW
jgi:E3 ubiquitin-protein ligase HECTD4